MAEAVPEAQGTPPVEQVAEVAKDLDGDLVIRVGTDKACLLRVHSTALKLASPVFRAMLGPKFAEGRADYAASSPLHLPDENPESFRLLCLILHHQPHAQEPSDLSKLVGLTVIADKYQCIPAITSLLSSLIGPMLPLSHLEGPERFDKRDLSLENILCITYLMNEPTMFWRASKRIVATVDTHTLKSSINEQLLMLMPAGFIGT